MAGNRLILEVFEPAIQLLGRLVQHGNGTIAEAVMFGGTFATNFRVNSCTQSGMWARSRPIVPINWMRTVGRNR